MTTATIPGPIARRSAAGAALAAFAALTGATVLLLWQATRFFTRRVIS